jgi:adenylate kinase family enzyme
MPEELLKTSQSKTYHPTPEQLARWKRLDENDGAIAGRMPSEEEQARIVKEFLNTDFVADQLAKVRMHKEKLLEQLKSLEESKGEQQEKLLKKLKWAEEYEQQLLEKQQGQS